MHLHLIVLLLSSLLPRAVVSPPASPTAIVWWYDTAALAPCSSTVTVNCFNGFEVHHFTGGTDVKDAVVLLPSPLPALSACPNQSTTTCIGFILPFPPTFPQGFLAPTAAYVIATGIDGTGAKTQSGLAFISYPMPVPIGATER